jgi:hypothetical protein
MFTGMYLHAMVERARRTGAISDKEQARRLAQGLLKCASVSDVPGFVARGVGSDGKCHYPLSSDDQMHPWFLGLHAYLATDIPTADERKVLVAKVREVAGVLEANGWRVPCDGSDSSSQDQSASGILRQYPPGALHSGIEPAL